MKLTLRAMADVVTVTTGTQWEPYTVKRDGHEAYEIHLADASEAGALCKRIPAEGMNGIEVVSNANGIRLYARVGGWRLEVDGDTLSPPGLISLCRYLAHRHGVTRHTSMETDFTFYGFHRHSNLMGMAVNGVHIMGFELSEGIITHGMSDQAKAVHVYTPDPTERYTLGIRLGTHGYPWWDHKEWPDGGSASYAKLEKLESLHQQIRDL